MADPGPAPHETLPGLQASVRATVRSAGKPRRKAAVEPVAEVDPVARVLVETPLAHLDRPFDYAVPASMAERAVPGARVKVRFAGKDLDGFVVARAASSEHTGTLTPLRRVVSPEPVLLPAVADLAGVLAERYAGTRSDVLRLAVPARHATTEAKASPPEEPLEVDPEPLRRAWSGYAAADAYLAHLATGGTPRAVWSALPGDDWPRLLAAAAAATLASGRGSVVVVPDHRDLARVDAALTDVLGAGHHVVLTAGAGPARRYREFLAVSRGTRRIVVGTRAASFAPVHDLGLVAIWDDGDDLHAEPRAPYPHAREVLLSRALLEDAAVLVGGFSRSVEAEQLVATGWAHEIVPSREAVRAAVTVSVSGATDRELERDPLARASRMPKQVHDVIGAGLERGPVLLQTPRRGYAPALACERCRTPARCATCT
ncbi:MAG: primosome assembly protein PriA, partial [Nocardioides sp.]